MLIIIQGRLPGLNEYTKANRSNVHVGNGMKRKTEDLISLYLPNKRLNTPVRLIFHWYEKNKRRDKDNIAMGKKFILDAFVTNGLIPNDGWSEIESFQDRFYVDKKNPRIEIEVIECE